MSGETLKVLSCKLFGQKCSANERVYTVTAYWIFLCVIEHVTQLKFQAFNEEKNVKLLCRE
jgi:hypothetical protein